MPIQYDFNHMPAHLNWIWHNNFHLFSTGFVCISNERIVFPKCANCSFKDFYGQKCYNFSEKKAPKIFNDFFTFKLLISHMKG